MNGTGYLVDKDTLLTGCIVVDFVYKLQHLLFVNLHFGLTESVPGIAPLARILRPMSTKVRALVVYNRAVVVTLAERPLAAVGGNQLSR